MVISRRLQQNRGIEVANNNGYDIERLLWTAADKLWANSGPRLADYSIPVFGPIYLS